MAISGVRALRHSLYLGLMTAWSVSAWAVVPMIPGDRSTTPLAAVKTLSPPPPKSLAETYVDETGPTAFQKRYPWAYLDLAGSVSYAKPTVSDLPEQSPTLLQWGLGATAAFRREFGNSETGRAILFIGATSEYRYIGQYSSVNADVGNFKGSRFSAIAPTIGTQLSEELVIKISPQIMGNYTLSNPTAEASKLVYKGPMGFTAVGLFKAGKLIHSKNLHLGLQIEYLAFSSREIVGVSERSLETKLSWFLIGAAVGYVF